jgi:hypothetical protein
LTVFVVTHPKRGRAIRKREFVPEAIDADRLAELLDRARGVGVVHTLALAEALAATGADVTV